MPSSVYPALIAFDENLGAAPLQQVIVAVDATMTMP
jgi:hypothetical protein